MDRLKELQELRLKLHNEIKAHADKLPADGTESPEWKETWDQLNKAYDENMVSLDAETKKIAESQAVQNRLSAIDTQLSSMPRFELQNFNQPPQNPLPNSNQPVTFEQQQLLALQGWMMNSSSEHSHRIEDRHRQAALATGNRLDSKDFVFELSTTQAFNQYRRDRLQNALTGGQGTKGGFITGESFVASVERAMLDFSGVAQAADIIRTNNGEPIHYPTVDDTSNTGRLVGDGSAVTATAEPTFGDAILSAYTFTSDEIKVARALLEDSMLDLGNLVGSLLGERLGRIQNTNYTTGTGAGVAPRGVVTAATAGVTAASTSAIVFDEVIDLEHSLNPSRRVPGQGTGYMFNDAILQTLRKLKNGMGDYLWQSGANSGAPDTLNTWPYWINQAMASTIATTNITMLFGAFRNYKIRQVRSIRFQRLVERHAENDQDAFLAFVRGDGNLVDAGDGVVRKLTQA